MGNWRVQIDGPDKGAWSSGHSLAEVVMDALRRLGYMPDMVLVTQFIADTVFLEKWPAEMEADLVRFLKSHDWPIVLRKDVQTTVEEYDDRTDTLPDPRTTDPENG